MRSYSLGKGRKKAVERFTIGHGLSLLAGLSIVLFWNHVAVDAWIPAGSIWIESAHCRRQRHINLVVLIRQADSKNRLIKAVADLSKGFVLAVPHTKLCVSVTM
jgi:hypothetical protein